LLPLIGNSVSAMMLVTKMAMTIIIIVVELKRIAIVWRRTIVVKRWVIRIIIIWIVINIGGAAAA
jgi:hypothetical protein